MPISSAQISGMVGGQQVMFSNQHAYSQQLGGVYGTGPASAPPGMSSPQFPSYGSRPAYGSQDFGFLGGSQHGVGARVAGAGALAVPGLAAGASMLAGFSSGPARFADPFTATLSAFRAGTGAARGAGVFGTMGHIGGQFAAGGLRGGIGAIGGGLAMGAATAMPFMAAGAAISEMGSQAYQGAQQYSDVTRITGQMGPMYGGIGARAGGRMARHQVRNIVSVLENIAGENVMASMGTLTRLMERFDRMGMMTGIQDAASFKRKFSRLVQQVDTVAKVMGTSLEEAAPVVSSMQRMGLWTTRDIMGTAMAANVAGPAAVPQMMGAMQTGAAQSWQAGGTMRAGAMAGRRQFLNVQAAMRSGAMNEQQLMEYTGGVGGAEGMQQMAGMMTGTMSAFARTPMGRLMVAGLGETEGGRFTGKIDQGRLQDFMSGRTQINDLMKRGRGQTRSREGAASFTFNQARIGQSMVSQGGIEGIGEAISQVMGRAGYGDASEDIQGLFLQRMMGLDERQARMWQQLIKDLPKIRKQRQTEAERAIDDSFRRADERMNRSWQGFKDAIGHRYSGMMRPFRELGADISASVDESMDELTNLIYQRTPAGINVSGAERNRIMQGFGKTDLLSQSNLGVSRVDLSTAPIKAIRTGTSAAAAIQQMGVRGTAGGGPGRVSVGREGGVMAGIGGAMLGGAAGTFAGGLNPVATMAGVYGGYQKARGQELFVDEKEALSMQKTVAAAAGGRIKGMIGDNPRAQAAASNLKQELSRIMSDPTERSKLRRIRETTGGGVEYTNAILDRLRGSRAGAQAISELAGAQGVSEAVAARMGLAAAEEALPSHMRGVMGADWVKEAKAINADQLMRDNRNLRELADKSLEDTAATLHRASTITKDVGTGQTAMLMRGDRVMSGTGRITIAKAPMGISEMKDALNSPKWGSAVREYIRKGGSQATGLSAENNAFLKALEEGDPTAKKMWAALDNAERSGKLGIVQKAAGQIDLVAAAEVQEHTAKRIAASAETELGRLGDANLAGVEPELYSQYKSLLERMKSGSVTEQRAAFEEAQRLSGKFGTDQMMKLRGITGGGGLASQLAGMSVIGELGTGGLSEMSGKEFKSFKGRLRAAGMGGLMEMLSPEQKTRIEEMAKSDGKFDVEETKELKNILKTVGESIRAFTEAGREDALTKMTNTFNTYMGANMKFQGAITAYVMKKEGITQEQIKETMTQVVKENAGKPGDTKEKGAGEQSA